MGCDTDSRPLTHTSRSTIGLPAIPGTAVLPKCSIQVATSPSALCTRSRSASNSHGHAGSYSTMTIGSSTSGLVFELMSAAAVDSDGAVFMTVGRSDNRFGRGTITGARHVLDIGARIRDHGLIKNTCKHWIPCSEIPNAIGLRRRHCGAVRRMSLANPVAYTRDRSSPFRCSSFAVNSRLVCRRSAIESNTSINAWRKIVS